MELVLGRWSPVGPDSMAALNPASIFGQAQGLCAEAASELREFQLWVRLKGFDMLLNPGAEGELWAATHSRNADVELSARI